MTSVKGPSTQVASTNTIINKTPQNTRPITPVRKGILKRPTSPNRQQRRADSIVEDSSLQPKIQDPKSAEQDRKKKRAQFIGQPTISSNTTYENISATIIFCGELLSKVAYRKATIEFKNEQYKAREDKKTFQRAIKENESDIQVEEYKIIVIKDVKQKLETLKLASKNKLSISDSKKQDEAMNPESNLLEEYRKILVDVEIGDKHVLKKRVQKLQN